MSKSHRWMLVLFVGVVAGWGAHQAWHGIAPHRSDTGSGVDARFPAGGRAEKTAGPSNLSGTPHTAIFHALLHDLRFDEAVALLDSMPTRQQRAAGRASIRNLLTRFMQDGEYRNAENLLAACLAQDHRDTGMLLARSKLLEAQGRQLEAIRTLHEAKSYAWQQAELNTIREQIDNIVLRLDRRLQESGDRPGRIELYEYLTRTEPDIASHYLALAEARLRNGYPEQAWQALEPVLDHPDVGDAVSRLAARVERHLGMAGALPVSIPLHPVGNHYLVEARLNGSTAVRLMIDTGATMTAISRETLARAGMSASSSDPVRSFSTAAGETRGRVKRIASFELGEVSIADFEVAELELPSLHTADGLLGMDFLGNFRFTIDRETRSLHLSASR